MKGRCLNHLTMEPCFFDRFTVLLNSPSWARTSDNTVNSRALYQLSYRGSFFFILSFFLLNIPCNAKHIVRRTCNTGCPVGIPSKLHTELIHQTFFLTFSWLKPRPISNSQLHTLPHFHLCPIYLVVFKGSY